MWCSICFSHRTNLHVKGTPARPNALAVPSTIYTFRNVKDHSENKYHLAAVGLDARANSVVMDSIIHLPASVIPQAKVLLRTVLHMGRNQVAHRQLRFLLELQRRNGVTYNLGYTSAYTPVVMKFLAKAARGYLARLWHGATARSVMTDEVKAGAFQWLGAAARLFVFKKFVWHPALCHPFVTKCV